MKPRNSTIACAALAACIILSTLLFSQEVLDPAPEKDIIRFATNRTNYKAALEEIARRYETLHPEVRIELTFTGNNQLATYVRTREAAGIDLVPDIYNGNMTKGYDAQGKWVAFTPYLEQINPYTGQKFIESFKNLNIYEFDNYGGELYMLPLDVISVGLYYNKDIYDSLGLTEPKSWAEFMDTCHVIREAGYTPISMPGDFNSIWAGNLGWIVRILCDAYLRDHIPMVASQEGDWDFDPKTNADFVYNPHDPFFDRQTIINTERVLSAIQNGSIDFQSERFRGAYRRLKELSEHFQDGYIGADFNAARNAFVRQEAAMIFAGTSFILQHERNLADASPERKFNTGIMWLPPILDDPYVQGPIRSFYNGGTVLAVTKKGGPQHERRVMDFLMFIATPESGQLLHDMTLEDGYNLSGPLTIDGVKMGDNLGERYESFRKYGVMKLEFRGLFDEQKSIGDFVIHLQDYLGERTDLDTFLSAYDQSMREALERLKVRYNYDLDPSTRNIPIVKARRTNPWNPFDNGTLALMLLIGGYIAFAAINIKRAKGSASAKALIAFALLSPTFLFLLLFSYWPAISGLYFSLTDWSSWQYPNFIGWDNFTRLFRDDQFLFGLYNMFIIVGASIIKATVFPFVAAQLVLRLNSPRRRYFFRAIYLLPIVVPSIVIVMIWRNIYDPTSGMLNQILIAIDLETWTASWLGNHATALSSIIFMGFPWVGAMGFLIYLAALLNISDEIKDAFALESRSVFARILKVDIPLVRSQTRLLIILAVIGSIQDFQAILLMTAGGPGLATHIPAYSMYKEAFIYGNFGYGSAIGATLFAIILAFTLLNLKLFGKSEELS